MSYKQIQIPNNIKYVSEYFDKDLPDNAYINKVLTGCGATHFVLTNDIDYIVAIPFQSLGDNKIIQSQSNPSMYPYELFVYHSGVEQVGEKLREYLERIKERNHPIKLLVTYDSLPKLQSYLDFSNLKLFIDEGHKVLEYVGNFKPRVIKDMLDLIPSFRSFVTVTATPTREDFIPIEFQKYDKIQLCWSNTTQVLFHHCKLYPNQLKEVVLSLCLDYLRGDKEGNAYVFINSVDKITSFVKELVTKYGYSSEDIKVVCANSPNNRKSLRRLGKGFKPRAVIEEGEQKFYKINFITSTAFEGSDFLDPEGNTIIISDSSLEHTKLDISTQVSQIVGRLRVSKFKHIINMFWTISPTLEYKDEESYRCYLEQREYSARDIINKFNKEDNMELKEHMLLLSKKSPFLIEYEEERTMEYNENAVNHLMNNFVGTTLQYFVNTDSEVSIEDKISFTLKDVFAGEVKNNLELPRLSVKDKKKLGRKANFGKTAKYYLELLSEYRSTFNPETRERLEKEATELLNDNLILSEYIKLFGVKDLKELDESSIRENILDKRVTEYYQKEHLSKLLPKYFNVGSTYIYNELKSSIQDICDSYKIDIKAKSSDISLAFETQQSSRSINGVKTNTILLVSLKQ